MASLVHSVWR